MSRDQNTPSADWVDGFKAGLQQAIDIVHAEARWQWEQDQHHTPCAQVVAQRMGIVEDCLRGFRERAVAASPEQP